MAKGDRGLPMAAIERILKAEGSKVGVERVGAKAVKYMKDALEDLALQIAKEAITLAKHTDRKTVNKEDIKLAAKAILRNL